MAKHYSKKARGFVISAQTTEGIPTAAASIVASDSLACFEPTYDVEISNETMEYAGDEFSRDSRTDLTDRVLNMSCSTLMPSLGLPTAAPTISDFPQETLYSVSGASVAYIGTSTATAQVKVTNAVTSASKATLAVAAVSSDDTSLQKVYRGFDGNTVVDLEMEIDKRAKLKWSLKAIPVDWAATPEDFPEEITKVVPDYGVQKDNVMPTLSMRNITQAEIVVFGSKGYNAGTTDLPTPFTGTEKTFCFSKLSAPNLFGFSWERVQNSCQTGFEKLPVVPTVSFTVIEDDTLADLIPDRNFEDLHGMLEGYFAFALCYGTVAGKKAYIEFDKLQCVDVKNTEVGSRAAKELKFNNCGSATLIWNAA
jgi:hypothetical protein